MAETLLTYDSRRDEYALGWRGRYGGMQYLHDEDGRRAVVVSHHDMVMAGGPERGHRLLMEALAQGSRIEAIFGALP